MSYSFAAVWQRAGGLLMYAMSSHRPQQYSGEAHQNAKLTTAIVRAIRASTETDAALADALGISRGTVQCARTGASWRHLGGAIPAVRTAAWRADQRALAACGIAQYRRCHCCRQYDDPAHLVIETNGTRRHPECRRWAAP